MNVVKIKETDLFVKELESVRVVSAWDIARLHQKEVGDINKNFKNNFNRFEVIKDFYTLTREEISERNISFQDFVPNNVKEIVFFTERGYLKLVKTFTDNLSWEIQDLLIDNYFKMKEVVQFKVPQTFKEALLLAVEQQEKIEQQEKMLLEQKPKVDFYDVVVGSNKLIDMSEVAKIINIKDVGRNKLFEILRDNDILMKNNIPYQKYVDMEIFEVIETTKNTPKGNLVFTKTMVTQKGLDFLVKKLNKLECNKNNK